MQFGMKCFVFGILLICSFFRTANVQIVSQESNGYENAGKMVHASIKMSLEKGGFHREISYVVDFAQQYDHCDFTLEQELPAAVYVDTAQLSEWVRHTYLNISYPSFVDIERPTEKSKPIVILLHSRISRKQFWVPIHYRYHAPGYHKFIRVKINSPNLYMYCPSFAAANTRKNTNTKCFNESDALLHKCDWKLIELVEINGHPLKAHIPVGDKTLAPFFSCLTIVVSWAGCFTAVYTINRKMNSVSKKLI